MANSAKLVITVTAARGGSTVRYSTKGRYISLPVNTLQNTLASQPIQPTSSVNNFWGSVMDAVEQDITGHS